MRLANSLLAAYAFAEVGHALKLPFHLLCASALLNTRLLALASPLEREETEKSSDRIAIIGAGAGGSSAAFWISKAKERYGLNVEIDVFDEKNYVGGRSTTVQPYGDSRLQPIEVGGSLFTPANKNLWRASQEFGLKINDFSGDEGEDTTGIWDGKQFLYNTSYGTFVDWYGLDAPARTQGFVADMVETYLTIYSNPVGDAPWPDLDHLVDSFGWEPLVTTTASDYLDGQDINRTYTRQIIEGANRVNYGQNVDKIHTLGAFITQSANNAVQVLGGNWQIFDQFVKRANANLYLNTKVKSITQKAANRFVLKAVSTKTGRALEQTYSSVILAAPFHSTSVALNLLDDSAPTIPPQPYVHLHVTLLSTPNPSALPRYFGLQGNEQPPYSVWTSYELARATGGKEKPEFNSLGYYGKIHAKDGSAANLTALGIGVADGRDESGEAWSAKIFSDHRIDDQWLKRVFGKVGWVYRKEWDAYPVLSPTDTFPPVKLTKGLYYVNSFEPLISTMETETVSSRNVVELLMQEEYGASICKSNGTPVEGDDFVYGFDC